MRLVASGDLSSAFDHEVIVTLGRGFGQVCPSAQANLASDWPPARPVVAVGPLAGAVKLVKGEGAAHKQ